MMCIFNLLSSIWLYIMKKLGRRNKMEDLKIYQLNKTILCIDLKSFYASVECVLRGLDPFKTPLVVADKSRGGGSIVLAASPYLKSLGVPSRCRIFELPEDFKYYLCKTSNANISGIFSFSHWRLFRLHQ